MNSRTPREESVKHRIVFAGLCLAMLLIVLNIAIPEHHESHTSLVGAVKTQLDPACMVRAIADIDAGLQIIRAREHWRAERDHVDPTGRPTALYVTQRETAVGWEVAARAAGAVEPESSEEERLRVESATRDVAMHVLRRCADGHWDGGLVRVPQRN